MSIALPWRFASRLVIALATVGRRQPLPLLAVVVVAGVVIAVVQAVRQRQWVVAAVVSVLVSVGAVCTVVSPLVDAAVSRRSEYAADRYASGAGLDPHLAEALQVLDGGHRRRSGMVARLLGRHPSVTRRIAVLSSAPDRV